MTLEANVNKTGLEENPRLKVFSYMGVWDRNSCSPSNAYLCHQPVNRDDDLLAIADLEPIHSNIDMPFQQFFSLCKDYEDTHGTHCNKNKSHIYGVLLTYLMDKTYTNEELCKASDAICEHFYGLPFFAFCSVHGKGQYLHMFFSERYYYPEGSFKTYKSDVWVDPITHKYRKANTEGAIMAHKKGDHVMESGKKVITFFSEKTRVFNFGIGKNCTNKYRAEKNWFIGMLSDLFGSSYTSMATFPKAKYKAKRANYNHKSQIINKRISVLEKVYNDMNETIIDADIPVNDERCHMLRNMMRKIFDRFHKYANNQYFYEEYLGYDNDDDCTRVLRTINPDENSDRIRAGLAYMEAVFASDMNKVRAIYTSYLGEADHRYTTMDFYNNHIYCYGR